MLTILVPIDTPSVLYGIQGCGEVFYLTISEILQCLQIAELEEDIPELPKEWKATALSERRKILPEEKLYA